MTREDRLEAKHRTAVMALMRAERKMVAATTRWLKLREQVRRYDRLADKALATRIGGEYDPRELADLTQPEPSVQFPGQVIPRNPRKRGRHG